MWGASSCAWLPELARCWAQSPQRKRHCILLWMAGGPSQTDTFDMKPNHANGGEFEEIATSVPGLRISEHLPKLAQQADQLAILRGVQTKEGDHGRGTYLMRTGHAPGGPVRYPTLGSLISKELGEPDAALPNYVSVSPRQLFNPAAFSPGFLGPRYAAVTVGAREADATASSSFAQLGVDHLQLPQGVADTRADRRLDLWNGLQQPFLARHAVSAPQAQDTAYRRAVKMMHSDAAAAFDLSREPEEVREAYGRGVFGQGCLIARRLIERGVPFVEVTLGGFEDNAIGWDTHQDNFATVRRLSTQLDNGWGTLMSDLRDRGLLQDTTILWMGEFGRTPRINDNAGRDHFPNAWSCVLAGGGIQGGQAYGQTSEDGMEVVDGKVEVGDILSTLCLALGIDPYQENQTDIGRPIAIAEGTPISSVLA